MRTRSPGSNAGSALRVLTRIWAGVACALEPLDHGLAEQKALPADALLDEQDRGRRARGPPAAPAPAPRPAACASSPPRSRARGRRTPSRPGAQRENASAGRRHHSQNRRTAARTQAGRAEPGRRLDREREVHGDARAKPDRQPEEPALALREQVLGEPGQEARRSGPAAGHVARRRRGWRRHRASGAPSPCSC